MNRGTLDATRSADFDAAGTLSLNGNDIVLTDVAGFDIKTWSPDAFVIPNSGILLQPSSPGYAVRYQTNTNIPYSCSSSVTNGPDTDNDGRDDTASASGAWVDLAHFGSGQFSHDSGVSPLAWYVPGIAPVSVPNNRLYCQFNFHLVTFPGASDVSNPGTLGSVFQGLIDTSYDTWTPTYENDGVNQNPGVSTTFNANTGAQGVFAVDNGSGNQTTPEDIDEATDGIDNDMVNGPDDFAERETQPPYNHPITGLQVTFRMVEKQTGQVRQSSVVQRYETQ